MDETRVRPCKIDPLMLAPIRKCMDNFGCLSADPDDEWPHNVLSLRTVAYTCGALHRPGEPPPVHDHRPDELTLCRRLAHQAARIMDGIHVGMGSTSDDPFRPFFVAASEGHAPTAITAAVIRQVFGGSIHPRASLRIEPLRKDSAWWQRALEHFRRHDRRHKAWRRLMHGFLSNRELRHACTIAIGDEGDPGSRGVVYPRLILGLTARGSVAGIRGTVAYA